MGVMLDMWNVASLCTVRGGKETRFEVFVPGWFIAVALVVGGLLLWRVIR